MLKYWEQNEYKSVYFLLSASLCSYDTLKGTGKKVLKTGDKFGLPFSMLLCGS
jgi:hypothetical protein